MRKLSLIFAFILVLAFGQAAFAQNPVTATVDAGSWTDGTDTFLHPGGTVVVGITMVNEGAAGLNFDVGNGYQLNSPDGAGWVALTELPGYGTDPIDPNTGDHGWGTGSFSHWEWNGTAWSRTALVDPSPYDPIVWTVPAGPNGGEPVAALFQAASFAASQKFKPGQTLTYGIEFTTLPGDEGKTLCIDMADDIGANSWMWTTTPTSENILPTWGGPYCYVIATQPNEPPQISGPTNYDFEHCETGVINFTATENESPADDEYVWEIVSGPGTLVGANHSAQWSYAGAPQSGTATLEIRAKDQAGVDHWGPIHTVNLVFNNDAPVITECPAGLTVISTGVTKTATVVATDACDALTWSVDLNGAGGSATVVDGVLEYTADVPAGPQTLIVTVSDGELTASCNVLFDVIVGSSYGVRIPKIHGPEGTDLTGWIQGTFVDVPINLTGVNAEFGLGGFDLLIAYDPTALAFQLAEEGDIYTELDWEYFNYRQGPFGNCGNGCPSGMLRLIGMAETNDGPHHPSTVLPTVPVSLASMRFLVSNDRTLECQYVPIRFFWIDCGDNTLSSFAGDVLFASATVWDYYDDVTDVEITGVDAFPTYLGAQAECYVTLPHEKDPPVSDVDFFNGGVDIICGDEIDARGDLNLNGLAYEISDAVMFTNYFINGLAAFNGYPDGAIAASDANADGIPLTVSDLVYLIRVVVGDALPYPKLNAMAASYSHQNGVMNVASEMGAAHIVLQGNADVQLLASNMEMKTGMVDGNLNVLVFSTEANEAFVGNFLATNAEIVSVDFATYEGQAVVAKNVPKTFAVQQNYPNPFNPTTNIAFALPQASDYTISVFNVAGQLVETINGQSDAGNVVVKWDASELASGVYFYKVAAGENTKTMKAVLMK